MAEEPAASAVNGPPNSFVLMAAAKHVAASCAAQNAGYIACKKQNADPQECLKQGDAVTTCVLSLTLSACARITALYDPPPACLMPIACSLKGLHSRCNKTFNGYVKCMDYYSNQFDMCRNEQKAFEKECPIPAPASK
eukprot:jgi/Mesvir1/21918/Mv01975-RA.1